MKLRFDPILEQHYQNMRHYEDQFPFFAPSIVSFLEYEYWALHEAVFALTKWPTYGLCSAWISGLPPEVKKSRSSYYLPVDIFDAEKLPEETKNLFYQMKLAIDNGSLLSINAPLGEGISFIVKPREVIEWALFNNHILPLDLQTALDFYQQPQVCTEKDENRVKTKFVGQFLMLQNPHYTVTDLCEHDLMKLCGGSTVGNILEGVRRNALNELFELQGKRGRPRKDSSDRISRSFIPKPVSEVMHLNQHGVPHYNFRLLEVITTILVRIKIHVHGLDQVLNMTRREFQEDLLREPVMRLYLPSNSKRVIEFIDLFCHRALNRFLPVLPLTSLGNLVTNGGKVFLSKLN